MNLCPFGLLIMPLKIRGILLVLASVTAPSPHHCIKIEPFIPGHDGRANGLHLEMSSMLSLSVRVFLPFPEELAVSPCDVIPPRGQLPFGHTLDLMPLPAACARSPILSLSFFRSFLRRPFFSCSPAVAFISLSLSIR